jgi:hypothetical protein
LITPPSETLSVLLLPAQAYTLGKGGPLFTPDFAKGWATKTRTSLDSGVRRAVLESTRLRAVELPSLTPAETGLISEFVAVAARAASQADRRDNRDNEQLRRGDIDLSLGPSLSFLRDRTNAEYALCSIGARLEPGYDMYTALSSRLSADPRTSLSTLGVTTSHAILILVELRTGQLLWLSEDTGYQVAGLKLTDLHDTDSVHRLATKLLLTLHEIPAPRASAAGAVASVAARSTSPRQGEFAVKAPADWDVSADRDSVTATGDGSLLNVMQVELRSHNHAFPAIGRGSTRESKPQDLAKEYVADLQARNLADFQVVESTSDARLAGRPAFRVRFSYRLPLTRGGAQMEQLTVGTAVPNGLLLSQLSAPQLHYFAIALPAFEESTRTIELKPKRRLP